jgi:ATP-dependent Clp protease, protease subunit
MSPDPPEFPYPGIPPEIVPPLEPGPMVPLAPPPDDALRTEVYERLLTQRTIFLDRHLTIETASLVAAQLMTLDGGDDDQPIRLIVNSDGGPLDAVGGLLDTIEMLAAPVETSCLGQAVGTAAVVVAAGTGRRRAGPGASFRLRFPDIELTGTARRLGDDVAEHRRLHEALVDRLAAATGQEPRLVARDVERGRALRADEAVAYGLIDEVARKGG